MLCTVRPLTFRPRASGNTITAVAPRSPSLISTSTVFSDNRDDSRTDRHRTDERRNAHRFIFPFRRGQPRTSAPHDASCTGDTGDAERGGRGGGWKLASEQLKPPQTCSRARSLPRIIPSAYLPCLSKGEVSPWPTSMRSGSSSPRGSSPVTATRTGREPAAGGDLELEGEDESADPRSSRPASAADLMAGLEDVADAVRGLDSPTTLSPSYGFGHALGVSSHHVLPEVEMLPPLSPLWTEAGVPLETLDAYSAAGVVEQPENIGDWGHSRSGLLAFGMERVEHTTDSEANVASRQPTGPSHDFRNSAKTLVDRSPQARRHRRRPLVVSNPDQRHQLDLVLSLISERERAAAAAEDCAPAQTGPRDSCASADATTRSSNAPPSPCRRRRRRPMLVVSNPDEKDPMQCRGVGLWRGVDVQACM